MNRDDIIRMAREQGLPETEIEGVFRVNTDDLGRMLAAERERLKWDGLHSCHSECDRPACVHTRKAVDAEREACAQIAFNSATYIEAAKAIRARGSNV